jgi:glycosyltransferase involved in cell wall biosynthesis
MLSLAPRRLARDAGPRNGVLMMIGTLGPGGAERQLVATARALRARNHVDVAVTCVHLANSTQRFFEPDLMAANIEVATIGAEGEAILPDELRALVHMLPADLQEVGQYAATLWARKPQVAHLWLDEINIKGGLAAALTGVPRIIVSQRSLPPINFALHRPYMREAYRWLANRPNVTMINNSEAGARAYEAWLDLPRETIGVVRNGFAFSEDEVAAHRAARGKYRERMGIPHSAPVIGGIMRLSEEKRPDMWLEIAALVRAALPDVHFLVVGDGPLRKTLEKRANKNDLAGCVHFTGHLRDALDAVADMDLLLLTSRAEGLPNVLVEAQYMGVPVVATPVGGAPEALDHGKSGWLLDGDDVCASAERIADLVSDVEWRCAAAEQGPKFAQARFGMLRAVSETLALYGEPIER